MNKPVNYLRSYKDAQEKRKSTFVAQARKTIVDREKREAHLKMEKPKTDKEREG